tara:strand:+ start:461 stop:691 length:231 start_codon:yes stop_codon:yes gene_type:complete
MKRIYIKAFNQLTKLGVPVYEHCDDNGNFSISAEEPESYKWVGFSGDETPKLDDLLFAHGLFCEWVNGGRLAVYPA